MSRTKKGPGRPAGTHNAPRATVTLTVPVCPACGSPRRTPYTRTLRTLDGPGTFAGGGYERIEWKACSCAECGQALVHRIIVPAAAASTKAAEKEIEDADSCLPDVAADRRE